MSLSPEPLTSWREGVQSLVVGGGNGQGCLGYEARRKGLHPILFLLYLLLLLLRKPIWVWLPPGPGGVQVGWVLPGRYRRAGSLTCTSPDSHHLRWNQDIRGVMLIPGSEVVAIATGGQGPCLG